MKYNKGFALIALLAIIAGVLIVGGGAYLWGKNKGEEKNKLEFPEGCGFNGEQCANGKELKAVTATELKEFKNDEIGFSFSYPTKYGDINNVYPAELFIGKSTDYGFGEKTISGHPPKGEFSFIGTSNGVVVPNGDGATVVSYDKLSGQMVKTEFGEYKYVIIPAITDKGSILASPIRYMAILKLNSKSGLSYINFNIVGESMSLDEFKAMLQTVKIY